MPRSRALIAAALAVAFAVPSGARASDAGAPFDYIAQRHLLSEVLYPQTVLESVRVPTAHDGTEIYVEVVRPDPAVYGDVQLPVIMEISPYHGDGNRNGTRIFPDAEGGLTGYFPPRGYVVVMVDLRGTGRSGGCLDHLGPRDAKDMKEIVEWAAHPERAWNGGAWGRVGLTGHSYVGSTPSIAAAQRPRGLVTIVPSAGLTSMYDHQFQLGVPYNLQWIGPMIAYEQESLARYRNDYPLSPENAAGVGCGLPNSSLVSGPGQVTGQYELWHAQRDWRAQASQIEVPIFIVHGVNDDAARIPAAEWYFGHRYARPSDKVWIGQWTHGSGGHVNRRFDQWKYALHAWFDHHLKNMDVETGPPVEAFLNDDIIRDASVLTRTSWEQPRAWTTMYADARDGSLRFEPPDAEASVSFTGGASVDNQLPVEPDVTFTTEPLEHELVVLGLPRLQLNLSVTAPLVHIVTTLYREDVIGNLQPMNFCAIQPQLRYHPATPAPVIPGQEMDLHPQCFTMAHRAWPGDRLVLRVATNSDHHVPTMTTDARVTVFTGPGRTAYELPEVPEPVLYPDVALRAG